jgi:hypothetical protein
MDRAWEWAAAGRKLKPPGCDGKAQISDHGLGDWSEDNSLASALPLVGQSRYNRRYPSINDEAMGSIHVQAA